MVLKAALMASAMAFGATAVMAEGAKILVIGGKADDPFWSIVKRGAEDAGKLVEEQGGSVTWLGPQNYDTLGADAADLIRTAIAQDADAIVGPDWLWLGGRDRVWHHDLRHRQSGHLLHRV